MTTTENEPSASHLENVSFGHRLREILDQRNMSQAQLARDCRLDRSEINRLCNDKRDPRPHEVVRIGRALGMDAQELLTDVEMPSEFKEVQAELERISAELLKIEQEHNAAVVELQTEKEQMTGERTEWDQERVVLHQRIAELQHAHAQEVEELQVQGAQQAQLQTDQLARERERCAAEVATSKRTAVAREQQLLTDLRDARDAERRAKGRLGIAKSRVKQLDGAVAQLQTQVSNLKGQRVLTGVLGALGGIMLGASGGGDEYDDD